MADTIFVRSFDLSGRQIFDAQIVSSGTVPVQFRIGDSHLEYGDGKYGAYYSVQNLSGHQGDTLRWVDAATGTVSTEWTWGCSHSMSTLLRHHPTGQFVAGCVTDCYPGSTSPFSSGSIGGIYLNHDASKVLDVDAACNGSVAGELGSLAPASSGFKMVFNAHQNPATKGELSYSPSTMNQDIGFASIASDLSHGGVTWLTNTTSINEADSSIARFKPAGESAEQYLVGWSESGSKFKLGRLNASGGFVEGPFDVTGRVKWGRRDDPFRTHSNGDAVWAWFDAAGSSTLRVARVVSGGAAVCAP